MKNEKRKVNLLISVALIVLVVLLAIFLLSGDNLVLLKSLFVLDLSTEELRDKLMDFGIRGYITIAVLSMLQIICTFLPAEPIQVLAGLSFGFPIGLACCAVGVFLGNSLIYLLYKTYGDGIRRYFVRKLHFDFEKVANSGKSAVIIFILYLMPAIPYGMICFFAASIGIRWRRFILITFLSSLPSVCIGVGLGHMALTSQWMISVCVFLIILALAIFLGIKREWAFTQINNYADKLSRSSKNMVKDCSPVLLSILCVGLRVYFFLCGVRISSVVKCEKPLKSPSIVLCNHGSFFDFYYAGRLLIKNSPHFIIARLYFYHKWLGRILKMVGGFPKSMFAMDMESVRNSLKVLKDGGMLAMMPEARLSTVGKYEDIQESTFSFLKKSNVPVYTIKISGDYFAKPKWGKGFRRGSVVEAELDLLFSPADLECMSVDEIKQGVEERLYYDEFEWLKAKPEIKYESKCLAEGLENILTICPVCKKKHTITTDKRDIFCEECGKLTSLDGRYRFTPDFCFENFAQWYDWQMQIIQAEIEENPDYSLVSAVELRLPSADGKTLTRFAGRGVCTLDRSGLTYAGTRDGEHYEIHFTIQRIYRLLFGAGENFEVYNGSEILYFVPDERRSAVDWYMASMILNNMATSNAETPAGK